MKNKGWVILFLVFLALIGVLRIRSQCVRDAAKIIKEKKIKLKIKSPEEFIKEKLNEKR